MYCDADEILKGGRVKKRFFKLLPQAMGMVIAAYKNTEQEAMLFNNQFLADKAIDLTRKLLAQSKQIDIARDRVN